MNEYNKLFSKFNFSKEELDLLNSSQTANIADSNQIKAISEIYLAKTIEQCVDKMITSNVELEKSNELYNKKTVGLTKALVFVGIVQAIATFGQVLIAFISGN